MHKHQLQESVTEHQVLIQQNLAKFANLLRSRRGLNLHVRLLFGYR